MYGMAIIVLLLFYIAQLPWIILREYRRTAYMTAWLVIVFICPFIGLATYIVWGRRFGRDRGFAIVKRDTNRLAWQLSRVVDSQEMERGDEAGGRQKLYRLLAGLDDYPITSRNHTTVLTDGHDAYEAILAAIGAAKRHIHLDYYTIRDDGIGGLFCEALVRKAKQGVEVRVLYDGIGSRPLSPEYIGRLRGAGVSCCCFMPARLALHAHRLNFRNHRKIVVVDGNVGFVGGINIGDEYLGHNPKLGYWRDTHLRLEGDAVYFLQELFLQDWEVAARERLDEGQYMHPHHCAGNERVQMVPSMPGLHDQKIKEVLFAALTAASTRIYLTTPYFIPDPPLIAALRAAAQGGVDVRIIIPDVADSRLVMLASLSYVAEMLAVGVKVYRYEKGFIHAKVLLVDRLMAMVGTANFDIRSLNSNFEINAVMYEEAAIRRLETDFMLDLQHSRQLDAESFERRPRRQKLAEAFMHMLSPLL
jgi:cardiolipin synthase